MAGLRGSTAWIMAAKQALKGTPATVAALTTYKNPFSGGNIGPVRETDNLSETDSSRDQGVAYVTSSGIEGSPEFYARDASAGFWLFAALGADAPTGAGPNYTHVITPNSVLPYVTIWRDIADTLYERYTDCKVSSLTVSAEAGAPLTLSAGIQGAGYLRLPTDPSLSPAIPLASQRVYNYNDATVALGTGGTGSPTTALVRSFELSIENNVSRQQTDSVEPYDVVEGQRVVTLGFDMLFETLAEYNKFHTGSAAGTTISPDIYTTDAIFTFDAGANNSIAFNLPSIAYQEFPVEPQPGGDPITVSVRAVAQRGTAPVVTATVKNQIATY